MSSPRRSLLAASLFVAVIIQLSLWPVAFSSDFLDETKVYRTVLDPVAAKPITKLSGYSLDNKNNETVLVRLDGESDYDDDSEPANDDPNKQKNWKESPHYPKLVDSCGEVPKFQFPDFPNGYSCESRSATNANRRHRSASYIAGGREVKLGEFPSYVRLDIKTSDEKQHVCGGTLISDDVVVTAGHCLLHRARIAEIRAFMGIVEFPSRDMIGVSSNAFCLMPGMEQRPMTFVHNDVGVIILSKRVKFTDHIQPACLGSRQNPLEDAQCFTVGMGRTWPGDTKFNRLNALPVKYACNRMPSSYVQERTCYISNMKENSGNACPGDSGGPTYCINKCDGKERQFVVGAVSFGRNNCLPNSKSIFYSAGFYKLGSKLEDLISSCKEQYRYKS